MRQEQILSLAKDGLGTRAHGYTGWVRLWEMEGVERSGGQGPEAEGKPTLKIAVLILNIRRPTAWSVC